jgi:Cu2+-exporting ATPase
MHCESCVTKIGEALRSIPGIVSSRVTLQPPQATVAMERYVLLSDLQNAARRAGKYTLHATVEGEPATLGGPR